jgi:lysozyme
MEASSKAIAVLKHYEQGPHGSAALVPYFCPANKKTWYWGHVELPGEHLNGTLEEAEVVLARDVAKHSRAITALLKTAVSQDWFDALVCMGFNMGEGKADGIKNDLADSTLLAYVNSGKLQLAAGEFGKWVHGGGVVLPGLVKRRRCEMLLATTGQLVFP